jgi:hypothetical protein
MAFPAVPVEAVFLKIILPIAESNIICWAKLPVFLKVDSVLEKLVPI